MIELLQFPPMLGLMNASPFCMKVEVFLRLAGLEYRTVSTSPLRAPKGKLPVIRDEGRTILAHVGRGLGFASKQSRRQGLAEGIVGGRSGRGGLRLLRFRGGDRRSRLRHCARHECRRKKCARD